MGSRLSFLFKFDGDGQKPTFAAVLVSSPFSLHTLQLDLRRPEDRIMTTVLQSLSSYSSYRDSRSHLPIATQHANLAQSATVYVGNLSFFTTEEQIYELFSRVGEVKRIIMGLDRNTKTPCGFCFVEFFSHLSALHSLRYLSGTKLDERFIRADLDPGYAENRQYGRGKSGGQVRDEYRDDFDAGRGGWGHLKTIQELEQSRQKEQDDLYANDGQGRDVPMGDGGRREEDDGEGERWRGEREDR